MNVGVFAVDDIRDDGPQSRFAQRFAVDAAAHLTQGVDGVGVADADDVAILQTKPQPSGLGERRFVMGDEIGRDLVQRCYDLALAGAQQDPVVGGEAFGAADEAVLVHEHHGFVLGVDADAAGSQGMRSAWSWPPGCRWRS